MKIAYIITNAEIGSVAKITKDLYLKSEFAGHECLICYGRGSIEKTFKAYKIDNSIDIHINALISRITDSDGLHSKHATKLLIKRLKEFNADVIHIHCLHGYYINYPLLFLYLQNCNAKIVWTMHDCWGFTGHCCYFDLVDCKKWENGCSNCPNKRKYPKSILLDKSKRNYELKRALFNNINKNNLIIVTPSLWLKKLISHSFLSKFEIKVINNGIEIDLIKETVTRKKGLETDKKIILGVANVWDERKGLNDFCFLANNLPSEYTIVLVGLSQQQIKKLPNNIIGIERTKNFSELLDLYIKAYVFVNPTYEDNYPTTNVEASACGTPIITYNTGGSAESINLRNSYIVDKNIYDIIKILKTKKLTHLKVDEIDYNKLNKDTCYLGYLELYAFLSARRD